MPGVTFKCVDKDTGAPLAGITVNVQYGGAAGTPFSWLDPLQAQKTLTTGPDGNTPQLDFGLGTVVDAVSYYATASSLTGWAEVASVGGAVALTSESKIIYMKHDPGAALNEQLNNAVAWVWSKIAWIVLLVIVVVGLYWIWKHTPLGSAIKGVLKKTSNTVKHQFEPSNKE